ncbi:MAG: leucine-rich repeat domain-containing protein, partial [Methanosarcinales archaeon]|nr:leucine-rich repeat domain-containing protein [Methanosarcinales archaeon]
MSDDYVLQKIKRAARDKATVLDLSGNQLTTLPLEIGELKSLTALDLSHNQLNALPPEIGE